MNFGLFPFDLVFDHQPSFKSFNESETTIKTLNENIDNIQTEINRNNQIINDLKLKNESCNKKINEYKSRIEQIKKKIEDSKKYEGFIEIVKNYQNRFGSDMYINMFKELHNSLSKSEHVHLQINTMIKDKPLSEQSDKACFVKQSSQGLSDSERVKNIDYSIIIECNDVTSEESNNVKLFYQLFINIYNKLTGRAYKQ